MPTKFSSHRPVVMGTRWNSCLTGTRSWAVLRPLCSTPIKGFFWEELIHDARLTPSGVERVRKHSRLWFNFGEIYVKFVGHLKF